MAEGWTEEEVPDQKGRVVIITGANTGLGFETARVFAARRATVVLACRDVEAGERAVARIGDMAGAVAAHDNSKKRAGRADEGDNSKKRWEAENLRVVRLDLASLASVRTAADEIGATHDRIDLLINNAGVMMPPLSRTAEGFELQLGVNHLGHFALTGLLLPLMADRPGARIVTVSSGAHHNGRIDFDDLQAERGYRRYERYCQSKLANLMFTFELQRRLEAAGADAIALAAHPGLASTELFRNVSRAGRAFFWVEMRRVGQDARMGALATLRAAADRAARGSEYYGPGGRGENKGYPRLVPANDRAHDAEAQQRLWQESERLTGVAFPLPPR
jgi:NAD(P)-dependent dehydrogenase (short-subunit alcohol dehydrogenase family)